MSPAPARLGRTGLLLLVGIALGWGLNWPIMKHVLTRLPPLSFRSFCLVAGGLGVLLLARRARQPITIPAHWRRCAKTRGCSTRWHWPTIRSLP